MCSIKKLIEAYKVSYYPAIKEFNEVRLGALEQFWGRSFVEEMANEDNKTVEVTKSYSRSINNCFYRLIHKILPEFNEHTTSGSDYKLVNRLLEDKNSFSAGNGWAGNNCTKCDIHILKKFGIDEYGKINKVFIAIVDLSACKYSSWSKRKSEKTNFTNLSFMNEDMEHIQVIVGKVVKSKKKCKFIMDAI